MNANDLRSLRTPLLALVLVVATGAGLLYYIDQTLTVARRDLARQQAQLREARTKVQKSGDERDLIVKYADRYRYLQQIGFAGEEQRLNWVDALRLSNQQAQLFGISYQIESQKAYPYANELDPGQLGVFHSAMKVDLGLLHEGDLVSFLATLARQRAGFFAVNECRLTRAASGNNIRLQPNLRASCELSWITLRPTTSADKKP